MNLPFHCKSIGEAISKHWLSWPLIFSCLFFLAWVPHAAQTTLLDPDTYLHITIGRNILESGVIPSVDSFSHTMRNAPWIAHEWLADILLAAIHQKFGWAGLHILTIGSCAVTLAYVMRFQLSRHVPAIYALLFTSLTTLCLLNHLLARPHVLTWPIITLWFGGILQAGETGKRPSFWLIPLIALWANLHGSYVLGIAISPFIAADALLTQPKGTRIDLFKGWCLFIFVSSFATLLTPYGWHSFQFSYELLTQPGLSKINEWQAVDFSHINALEIWIGVIISLACLGMLRLPVMRLFIMLVLIYEAAVHVRYISLFGLLAPLIMALPFEQQYHNFNKRFKQQNSALDDVFAKLARPAARSMTLLITALTLGFGYLIALAIQPMPFIKFTPEAAVAAARKSGLENKTVFNDYPFGGYLIYEGIPVFIDGRADMYGPAFLKEYFDAIDPKHINQFSNYLDKHQVEWTLLPPNNYLVDYLSEQTGWKKIYADDYSVIHQRAR